MTVTTNGKDGMTIAPVADPGPQQKLREKIYVAGPMTGLPQFNFPAFDKAAASLRAKGYEVVSPAELDDPESRALALASPDGAPGSGASNGETWEDFLRRDILIVAEIDGIAVLPGWENSKGATFEVDTANKLGCWVRPYIEETKGLGPQIPRDELARKCLAKWASVWGVDDPTAAAVRAAAIQIGDEVRVTDPNTGGQKGQKIERFDLIPAEAHRQLALVYGAGAKKYDDDNWRKGYAWRLSLGAMERHINAWKQGEEYDPEVSQLAGQDVHHLACAAWHCYTLMTFSVYNLGDDNIPERS